MAIDDDDQSRNFPSFFKIIFEPRPDLQKMGIPIKFMTEYGSDLLDAVTLKIPTGKTWKVKLLKENGRVWLKEGWSEFVSYNSICHGHFLMFTYGGKCRFDVCIFDMTACEIEYPLHHPQRSKESQRRVSKSKTKMNPSAPISSSKEDGILALVRQYKKKFGALNHWHINKINSCQFGIPCFAVKMHPSYVKYSFRMNVPWKFATEYFTNTKEISCTLKNTTCDDIWPVSFSGSSTRHLKSRKGWKKFALDNYLRVDDICVFELIDPLNRLFNVNIIRDSSQASGAGVGVGAGVPSNFERSPKVTVKVISIDD